MAKFRVTATMHTDLEGVFEFDGSLEEMKERVRDGYIDADAMTKDGIGGWTWNDVEEIKKEKKDDL